ncbi:MAG: M1 family metallopeptidase [Rhizobacter sp.]|nr:M1 family metallopeptidase [Ferruginibacter sp.]
MLNKLLRTSLAVSLILCYAGKSFAQPLNKKEVLTRQDTLRGSIGEGRMRWDVLHYDVTVQPDYNTKTIKGKNILRFYDNGAKLMQIDMQQPMIIDSIIRDHNSSQVPFTREGNVYWAEYRDPKAMYKINPGPASVSIYFHGQPVEAKRPPWDGGWIWKKDKQGSPWMSAACQGLGASVWLPCKDHQSDEPDSGATLRVIVPDSLTGVGNGRMIGKQSLGNGFTQYNWEVKNPINSYNIIPYIGKYSHFDEKYKGEKGILDMDYWVLDSNLVKAKTHFADARRTMEALEFWFGPYPFYEDGYKLVESPHLGMEHQSAVAYGNNYKMGYLGNDLSGTGWGLKWDFIIVHESGHEWFGNNITSKDIADMWVHEGFTNYSETLFTDYFYGKEAGNDYLVGIRKAIQNDIPIIGPYGVNKEGSGDMYNKSGNMLQTIRYVIANDKKFRDILRGLSKTFYHQTVTTAQVEEYISQKAGRNFSKIFDQYLRTTKIPVLEYKSEANKLMYRWSNTIDGFDLPVRVQFDSTTKKQKMIYPTTEWKQIKQPKKFDIKQFKVDRNFYVTTKNV